MALQDGCGDVDDLPVGPAGVLPEQMEGLLLVEGVTLHQDPFGPLRDGPAAEGALEGVVLREALERDVHRALHLLEVARMCDVGEDAEPGGPVDERAVLHVEDRDDRARGLVDDGPDQLERLLRVLTDDDEGDVRQLHGRGVTHGLEWRARTHDLVPERGHRPGDLVLARAEAVCDEYPQIAPHLGRHPGAPLGLFRVPSDGPVYLTRLPYTATEEGVLWFALRDPQLMAPASRTPAPGPGTHRSPCGEEAVGPRRSRVQNRIDTPRSRFVVRGDRRNGVDRLSLVGDLDRDNLSTLEGELEGVTHAGGALIIDLRELESVDDDGVRALEETAMHAGEVGWWLFIVNSRRLVRDAFERAGADMLLSDTDVSEILASGDGEWSPTSLPALPRERELTGDSVSSGSGHDRLA